MNERVRNRLDVSVEALLAGGSAWIDALIRWGRRNPRASRLDELHIARID